MSFEEDKARLVAELAEAQAILRAEYGLVQRARPLNDGDKMEPTASRRTAVTAD